MKLMKAKWLFDEHPILIDKKLAAVIGFNEAVVLQQLNYWLHSNSAKKQMVDYGSTTLMKIGKKIIFRFGAPEQLGEYLIVAKKRGLS